MSLMLSPNSIAFPDVGAMHDGACRRDRGERQVAHPNNNNDTHEGPTKAAEGVPVLCKPHERRRRSKCEGCSFNMCRYYAVFRSEILGDKRTNTPWGAFAAQFQRETIISLGTESAG